MEIRQILTREYVALTYVYHAHATTTLRIGSFVQCNKSGLRGLICREVASVTLGMDIILHVVDETIDVLGLDKESVNILVLVGANAG